MVPRGPRARGRAAAGADPVASPAQATTPARATPPPAAKAAPATPQAAKAVTPAPAAAPATPVASPAGNRKAAVGSKSVAACTPFVGAASVSAILSEPEEPLSPEALPAPVAAPASPAPAAAAASPAPLGALSPLPPTARHALPFVPRASPASKTPAAPDAESLGALRRAYKNALIEQRGHWPVAPEAPDSPAALPPPRGAPRMRLQLPSVVVAPPPAPPVSYARALASNKAPKALGPKPSHDLAGIPVGCAPPQRRRAPCRVLPVSRCLCVGALLCAAALSISGAYRLTWRVAPRAGRAATRASRRSAPPAARRRCVACPPPPAA